MELKQKELQEKHSMNNLCLNIPINSFENKIRDLNLNITPTQEYLKV